MKPLAQSVLLVLLAALAAPGARAQRYHDPLSERETEQLRHASQEPEPKIKLFIKFTRARMDAIEKVHADAKLSPQERGQQIHQLLVDVTDLVDEVGRNLESFAHRQADLDVPLKQVIMMDSNLRARLRTLKQAVSVPTATAEYQEYRYALDDALDSVSSSDEMARDMLAERHQAPERGKNK